MARVRALGRAGGVRAGCANAQRHCRASVPASVRANARLCAHGSRANGVGASRERQSRSNARLDARLGARLALARFWPRRSGAGAFGQGARCSGTRAPDLGPKIFGNAKCVWDSRVRWVARALALAARGLFLAARLGAPGAVARFCPDLGPKIFGNPKCVLDLGHGRAP